MIQLLDVFDALDFQCHGYISAEQLHDLERTLNEEPLDLSNITGALNYVCGGKGKNICKREDFESVLREVERRRALIEKLKWDFFALDSDGDGRISQHLTLFLLKSMFGETFGSSIWRHFAKHYKISFVGVSFHQLKVFLCDLKLSELNEDEISSEAHLQEMHNDEQLKIYTELASMQEDVVATGKQEPRDGAAMKLRQSSSWLLSKIENEGIEVLLESDNDDEFRLVARKPKNAVTATDLIDLMNIKYNTLKKQLFLEMLKANYGKGLWDAMPDEAKQTRLASLMSSDESCKMGAGERGVMSTAFQETSPYCLATLLAPLTTTDRPQNDNDGAQSTAGKSTSTFEEVLLALKNRWVSERGYLLTRLKGSDGHDVISAKERVEIWSWLNVMISRARGEDAFETQAVAVAIAENLQRRTSNKDCAAKQLKLAASRLENHRGHWATDDHTFVPSLPECPGQIDVISDLLLHQERLFSMERVAMVNFLQGQESIRYRMEASRLSKDEKSNQLKILKIQYDKWMRLKDEEKLTDQNRIRRVLYEATALSLGIVKETQKTTSSDSSSASVSFLAELQTRQDQKCRSLVDYSKKIKQDLLSMRKNILSDIRLHHYENIASVVLGVGSISKQEEAMATALEEKYEAVRMKLLLEVLKETAMPPWNELSSEEKAKKLMKLKSKEKIFRDERNFSALKEMAGNLFSEGRLNIQSTMGSDRQTYLRQLDSSLLEDSQGLPEAQAPYTGSVLLDLANRHSEEQRQLIDKLKACEKESDIDLTIELLRLKSQKRQASVEVTYLSGSIVTGLLEREQHPPAKRLKGDASRHHAIAAERMAYLKFKHFKESVQDSYQPTGDSLSDWIDAAIFELETKQRLERAYMVRLLQDPDSQDIRQEAFEMQSNERAEQLAKLRAKRDELELSIKGEQDEHWAIMEVAGAIKFATRAETMEKTGAKTSLDDVTVSLLAELQVEQHREYDDFLRHLRCMDASSVTSRRRDFMQDRKHEVNENVFAVFCRYEGDGNDKEIIQALEEKYDGLVDKMLLDSLRTQLGKAEWAALSEQERQERLLKLRLQQKRLMKEGRLDEVAKLLGDGFEASENLKSLMIDSRARYEQQLQERLLDRKRRLAKGESVSEVDKEIMDLTDAINRPVTAVEVLRDLQDRFDRERDALLSRLRGAGDQFTSERDRQAELVRLKRERRQAEREEKLDAAVLVFTLSENNKTHRDAADAKNRLRQEQLARERLERLKAKRNTNQTSKPDQIQSENEAVLQEAILKQADYKHECERKKLVELFEALDSSHLQTAELLTQTNRQSRAEQLFVALKSNDAKNVRLEDIVEITALKVASRMLTIKQHEEDGSSKEAVLVSLLADLQMMQDKEAADLMDDISKVDIDGLTRLQSRLYDSTPLDVGSNTVKVLVQAEPASEATEAVFLDALQSKYDALKDKLILESLEKQLGEAEWAKLSEQERQARLVKIKLEERRLRKEGRLDEVDRLFMGIIDQEKNLQAMLGESRALQEKRLQERLAKRAQRTAEGLTVDEIQELEKEEDLNFQEEEITKAKANPLLQLQRSFEEECACLLAGLRGANSMMSSEQQRQRELARIRREERIARREEKFDAAAMVIGLANRQHKVIKEKLECDRLRQEALAKERLAAKIKERSRRNMTTDTHDNNDFEGTDDVNVLQEMLLKSAEEKHERERNVMIELLNSKVVRNGMEVNRTDCERKQKQRKLKTYCQESRRASISVNQSETEVQWPLFEEAAVLKLEELMASSDDETEVDLLCVRILADLQDIQDSEQNLRQAEWNDQDVDRLKQACRLQKLTNRNLFDNISVVLLGNQTDSSETFEDELLGALDMKYDAIKERLVEEILKRQHGEGNWNSMSVEQKGFEIRKFMKEHGNDLEGIIQNSQETTPEIDDVASLFLSVTDSQVPGERKRNPLLCLKDHFEEEKEALLAALRGSDAKFLSERERQMAIAKLKRDRMRLKREEKLDNVALVFAMAMENSKRVESTEKSERERQLQLAKSRLESRRRKKQQISSNELQATSDVDNVLREINREILLDANEVEGREEEALLFELDQRHGFESEEVTCILNEAHDCSGARAAARNLTTADRKRNLLRMFAEYEHMKQTALGLEKKAGDIKDMNEVTKTEHAKFVTALRAKHRQLLLDITIIHMEERRSEHREEEADDDISASILASLEEIQQKEAAAVASVMTTKDGGDLVELKRVQRILRRYCLLDNMVKCLKSRRNDTEAGEEGASEMTEIGAEERQQLLTLESELEEERQRKRLKGMTDDDIERLMTKLRDQQDAKREAITEAAARQKEAALRRLKDKQRKKEEKLFEEDIAASLMMVATQQFALVREKTTMTINKQKNSLEERLRKRIELKKKRDHEEAEAREREKERLGDTDEKEAAKETRAYVLPAGMGLRREKTVVEEAAEMEESTKKEIVGFLMREQTGVALKMHREQTRQEERVKSLRKKLKKRLEDREQEAANLIGHVERQKTIVLNNQKEERNRQITTIRDRVARIKYERTLTQKEPRDKQGTGFQSFIDEDAEEINEDEKMVKVAEQIEKKFREEQRRNEVLGNASEFVQPFGLSPDSTTSPPQRSPIADDKARELKLKERLANRKRSRLLKQEANESEAGAQQGDE